MDCVDNSPFRRRPPDHSSESRRLAETARGRSRNRQLPTNSLTDLEEELMWWKTRLALRLAFLTHRTTAPSEFGASIAATPMI